MLTVLGHDRMQYEPVVIAGHPGSWDAQGGMVATEEQCRRLEKEGISYIIMPSLVRPVSPWNDLCAVWTLVGILRAKRPAIVHTHTSKAGVIGRVAAWFARVPVIVHTPHGHVFYGHFGRMKSWLFLQIERALCRVTSMLVALTSAERDDHLERAVGCADRFAVIPSGIDVERFRRARVAGRQVPQGFNCSTDATIVGSIGWLTDIKGHRVLVEAVGYLKDEFPGLHAVIVGSGGQHHALLAQADSLGVRDRIHLVGHRDDIEQCLAGMDCFVFPSLNEGMGRALIEAMAAGLPVVASRVGGIPAIVRHEENGLLVEAGDGRALSEALRRILGDPQLADRLGRNASRTIGDAFGVQAMVDAVESVYRRALQAHA
jgi:glycosyltransferase involved in cell wall biosynthesis